MTPAQIKARCAVGEGGCWEWPGPFDHTTPALWLKIDGRRVKRSVRRLLSPAQPGRRPSADCGNWRCVTPAHIVWLTRSELMRRMGPRCVQHTLAIRAARRRQARKLDLQKAREIRARLLAGEHKLVIAAEYGVHRSTVRLIEIGRCWAEVTPWSL